MPPSKKVLELIKGFTIFDLPIGVYLVTKEGLLIESSEQVRKILDITHNSGPDIFISDYYCSPYLREELKQRLENAEKHGKWIEKQLLPLKVSGREVYIQDYTRSIRDPDTYEILGYLCCMVDITEEERYKQLFEQLPIGFYQLDANDVITNVNQALASMLGYEFENQIVGRSVKDFYARPDGANIFRKIVEEKSSIVNQTVELLKKDGNTVFASVSARKVTSPDGKYFGREGTMMDVTTQERYRGILEHVPVGLYAVRAINGEDIITDCNQQFALINEFESKEQAIGYEIKKLHKSPVETKQLMDALKESDRHKDPLNGHLLNIITIKGNDKIIEVNSRLLTDQDGNITGRTGAVRDITIEAGLKKKVEEITEDIGNVLHTYTSTLLTVQYAISSVMQSFRPDPFDGERELLLEDAVASLPIPAKQLAGSVEELLHLIKCEDRIDSLAEDKRAEMARLLHVLKEYDQIPYVEAHQATLGEAALKIVDICGEIQKGKLPREKIRQVRGNAQELLRICNLIDIHQARDVILEMDHQVRSLREFITSDVRIKEKVTVCKISTLVSQVVNNLYGFARWRGVIFKQKIDATDVLVEVVERNVIRALANLLHNAIKYSWRRKDSEHPWVTIRVVTSKGNVQVEFENWGVPIQKDEIKKDLVFHIGFRGKSSGDRGRVGTGIGLTDARRVARKHSGDVTIDSRPALFGGRDDDYKQPFLTTATLILPIYTGLVSKE